MAGLPTPPGFGTNSWDEITWADAQATAAARFRVADAAAWKASPAAGLDRTVQIAAGGGWCCGVWDRTTAAENAPQHDTNTGSSDRFDVVVATYNWATRTRTFAIIKGGSTPPAMNTGAAVDATKINRLPHLRYDGVVAIVRVRPGVGPFAGTDIVDQRTWGSGAGGPALVANMASRPQLDRAPGQRIAAVTAPHVAYTFDGTRWVQEGLNTEVGLAPAGSYVSLRKETVTASVTGGGGTFWVTLANPHTMWLWAEATIGDTAGDFPVSAQFAPGPSLDTPPRLYFTSYKPGGAATPIGQLVRATVTVAGYNT